MSELLINLSIYDLPPDSIDFFSVLPGVECDAILPEGTARRFSRKKTYLTNAVFILKGKSRVKQKMQIE
jgi:hypothetical protein